MNYKHLSRRLQKVADYVPNDTILADIGSDHAYLPCYLVEQNRITSAIAGEVVQGPYQSAKKHVSQLQLHHRIKVRLADGLMAITSDDKVDTVTICGMGGDLITSILDTGYHNNKLEHVSTLILQPNVDAHVVRMWLMQHGYVITDEALIEENNKIYDIIVATPSQQDVYYTEDDIMFGVFLTREKSSVFIKKWENDIDKYNKVISNLKKASTDESDKIAEFHQKINKIKEIIYGTS